MVRSVDPLRSEAEAKPAKPKAKKAAKKTEEKAAESAEDITTETEPPAEVKEE